MRRIVFLGDPHLSDRQISTRVDDTTETCLEKFEWVLKYAASIEADIICTGDDFSHTLYSNKTRYRLKEMLGVYKRQGYKFVSISGNHSGDVEDRDFSSVRFRELGLFCMDGYVTFLGDLKQEGKPDIYLLDDLNGIVGFSAYEAELVVAGNYKAGVVGLVCHHWIGDAFNDSLVVYPDDMKKVFPNLKFIVAGHDHAFHEPYVSRDGVLVVRPGSMMRTDAGESSRRIPCVAVWDPNADVWEYVPIACARPYDEVFYSEKRGINADSVNALDQFVRRMQNQTGTVMDINEAIKEQFEKVPTEDQDLVRADLVSQGFVV